MAADAPGAITSFGSLCAVGLVVGICQLGGCAMVRAGADGSFAGRKVPLRDAGADLNVYYSVSK
jgi:hypothetical protein